MTIVLSPASVCISLTVRSCKQITASESRERTKVVPAHPREAADGGEERTFRLTFSLTASNYPGESTTLPI